jgi:hypothetical protein
MQSNKILIIMSDINKIVESKVHSVTNELKLKVSQTVVNIVQKIKEKHL